MVGKVVEDAPKKPRPKKSQEEVDFMWAGRGAELAGAGLSLPPSLPLSFLLFRAGGSHLRGSGGGGGKGGGRLTARVLVCGRMSVRVCKGEVVDEKAGRLRA
jgi:hypothetical protein